MFTILWNLHHTLNTTAAWLFLVAALFFQPFPNHAQEKFTGSFFVEEELSAAPPEDDHREYLPLDGFGIYGGAVSARKDGDHFIHCGSGGSFSNILIIADRLFPGSPPINVFFKEIRHISVSGRAGPFLC